MCVYMHICTYTVVHTLTIHKEQPRLRPEHTSTDTTIYSGPAGLPPMQARGRLLGYSAKQRLLGCWGKRRLLGYSVK
jgi:hypothetical protein